METRRKLIERKIEESRAKIAVIEAQLKPLEDLQKKRDYLILRIERLKKKLEG